MQRPHGIKIQAQTKIDNLQRGMKQHFFEGRLVKTPSIVRKKFQKEIQKQNKLIKSL